MDEWTKLFQDDAKQLTSNECQYHKFVESDLLHPSDMITIYLD